MEKKIKEMDVSTKATILVPRNIGLEGHLLYNPAPAIRNRRLLSMPNSNVRNSRIDARTSMVNFGASTSRGMTSTEPLTVPASTLDHCNFIFYIESFQNFFFRKHRF